MKALIILVGSMMIAGLSGCAHSVMRGSVAMKTSESEAHVCLGKGDVSVGDRVTLFQNICTNKGTGNRGTSLGYTGATGSSCEKKEVGKGSIQEILNQHYSVVKFDPGVKFEEGSIVEKY